MRLYEDIIRERSSKGPDYMNALLELEVKRDYGRREQTLRWDIEQLLARIASIGRDFYPIKEEVGEAGEAGLDLLYLFTDWSCWC